MIIDPTAPLFVPDWFLRVVVVVVLILLAWQLYRVFFPEPDFQFPEKMGVSPARQKEIDIQSEVEK